jgi:hypothetical protein
MTRDEFERRQDDQYQIISSAIKNLQALVNTGFKNERDQMACMVNCRKIEDNTSAIRSAYIKLEQLDEYIVDD